MRFVWLPVGGQKSLVPLCDVKRQPLPFARLGPPTVPMLFARFARETATISQFDEGALRLGPQATF